MLGDNISQAVWGEDFDPVAIRVLNKSQSFHRAVVGPLDERYLQLLESLAYGMDIGNGNSDMAEPLRFIIAMMVAGEICVALGSPIMSEFQQGVLTKEPFHAVPPVVRALAFECSLEAEKLQGKIHFLEVESLQKFHADHVAIKGQGELRVLDPQHGLIESNVAWCVCHEVPVLAFVFQVRASASRVMDRGIRKAALFVRKTTPAGFICKSCRSLSSLGRIPGNPQGVYPRQR